MSFLKKASKNFFAHFLVVLFFFFTFVTEFLKYREMTNTQKQ